ncbi:MAG: polysaccharide deacetylase family protein [Clostridium sp.]|nr:polysaccharide deacetylase family protein [Clostridium sp.]MCM1444668.1 polysaccharide deacetylase family protein [Candidatus Amulumruptor caecigallinarius]
MKCLSKVFKSLIIMIFITLTGCSNKNNYNFPILMYHSISDEIIGTSESNNLNVADFEQQMKYIHDNNIKTIFLDELDNYKESNEEIVVLTFDDGFKNFYTTVYPIIKKYNIKVNLFMITDYTAERYINYLSETQLIELDSSGLVRIGSHTKTHPRLAKMQYSDAYAELKESKEYLEGILNKPVTTLSYPYGNYDSKIIEAASKSGYEYAVLVSGGMENMSYNKLKLKRINVPRGIKLEEYISYIENAN